jgi:hypothetical protein
LPAKAGLRTEQYCSAKRRDMDQYWIRGRPIEQEPK